VQPSFCPLLTFFKHVIHTHTHHAHVKGVAAAPAPPPPPALPHLQAPPSTAEGPVHRPRTAAGLHLQMALHPPTPTLLLQLTQQQAVWAVRLPPSSPPSLKLTPIGCLAEGRVECLGWTGLGPITCGRVCGRLTCPLATPHSMRSWLQGPQQRLPHGGVSWKGTWFKKVRDARVVRRLFSTCLGYDLLHDRTSWRFRSSALGLL